MVWRLQRVLPQDPPTDSESSWEDCWCLSPLPPGHLQHPSHPQSPLHCRWSHPPDTQLLQSAAIREETAESPGQDQQTEGQLHPSGCQEAELPPELAPPPLSYPTHHWTLTPPPPPNTHTHTHTVTSTSHFVQHWTDLIQLPLLTVWIKTALWAFCHFKSIDKLFCTTPFISALLFISLVCTLSTMCLMLLYLFFIIIIIFSMSLFVYL